MSETIQIKKPVTSQTTETTKSEVSKYPTETIPLPTKGYFYDENHPLANGTIELKPMTAKEEDILANQDLIKKGKVLDKLIESLIVDKRVKPEEILVPDKNAIFIAIRRLAYGDEYKVNVTCPKCSNPNKIDINLSLLEYTQFDFEKCVKGQNSFTFVLPVSKATITYKILNNIDEQSIEAEINGFKKLNKESSNEITTRLTHIITSINGNSDKSAIRKFVNEEMRAKDSLELRKHIRDSSPDVDMSFDFKCGDCNYERRTEVPIGASFLWPDIDA